MNKAPPTVRNTFVHVDADHDLTSPLLIPKRASSADGERRKQDDYAQKVTETSVEQGQQEGDADHPYKLLGW